MPTWHVIRNDASVECVDADWSGTTSTEWTHERVVMPIRDRRWAVVRRLGRDNVVTVVPHRLSSQRDHRR